MKNDLSLESLREQEKTEYGKIIQKRREEIISILEDRLHQTGIIFNNVSVNFDAYPDEGDAMIEYEFSLPDGYVQKCKGFWSFDRTIDEVVERISENVSYIKKLRDCYPEYAKQNDYIQSRRIYSKRINLEQFGQRSTATGSITATLCPFLELPNTTEGGIGGGDYEIKRTPKRVRDFNKNIDDFCLFLSDCIAELRSMKVIEK